jgi:anti-sigma28 factor (negative regulator of flagellin synthesis)
MNRFEVSSSESGVFCMEPKSVPSTAGDNSKWLKQLREMPDVRLKKIMKIREEIRKGTYETASKWRRAVSRMIEDLG